ncbi:Ionotropic receptor 108 [Blattella germanica]|nr:Ionotropic receptor 108 [Blattella germanica]
MSLGCILLFLLLILRDVANRLDIKDIANIIFQYSEEEMELLQHIIDNPICIIYTFNYEKVHSISKQYSSNLTYQTGRVNNLPCIPTITVGETYIQQVLNCSDIFIFVIEPAGSNTQLPNKIRFDTRQFIFIRAAKNVAYFINVSQISTRVENISEISVPKSRHLPNYGGKLLNAMTFNCPVFSYGAEGGISSSSRDIDKLDGIEMKIFLEVAKRLNFSWKLDEPTDPVNKWGQKSSNGTWSGGYKAALASGKADVGFCCLWLMAEQYEDFDMTIPWDIQCSSFLVPRPRRLSNFGAIFSPFTTTLWVVIIVTAILTLLILHCLQRVRRCFITRERKDRSMTTNSMHILGILTLSNLVTSRPEFDEGRHIFAWWTVFALLITTAYSSGLVSHLTVPVFDHRLNTIRDLVSANVEWSEPYEPAMASLFDLQNPWHQRFIEKFHLNPERAKKNYRLEDMNNVVFGFILEGGTPYFLQGGEPMDPSGLISLRVMKECVSRYYLTFGLVKNSPYKDAFNDVLFRLIESGIVNYWKKSIAYRRGDAEMATVFIDEVKINNEPHPFILKNVIGTFIILIFGLILAILIYVAEICLR